MDATERLRRVYITGSAGGGKTSLARALSRCLRLQAYDMDLVLGVASTLELPRCWIVEGAYVWDVDDLLRRADIIVWLDLPMRTTVPRILRRHFRLSVLRRNRHRGLRRLWSFVRVQSHYFNAQERKPTGPTDWAAITRANTAAMLSFHAEKVIHLRSAAAVRRWRRSICRR